MVQRLEQLLRGDPHLQRAADVDGELALAASERREGHDGDEPAPSEVEPGPGVDVGEGGLHHVSVELSQRAERDLRRLSTPDRRRIVRGIEETLSKDPLPASADDRALSGRKPWRRLRVIELRVLYRELSADELPAGAARGRRIARIINRRDLQRAVSTLA